MGNLPPSMQEREGDGIRAETVSTLPSSERAYWPR